MGPLTLLKNFTFALGDEFVTDWVQFPAEFEKALLHTHLQTLDPASPTGGGLSARLQASYDTVEAVQIEAIAHTAVGSSDAQVSSGLAPLVRIQLKNTTGSPLRGTISVWLQAKRK